MVIFIFEDYLLYNKHKITYLNNLPHFLVYKTV